MKLIESILNRNKEDNISSVSSREINRLVSQYTEKYGRGYCLDIGGENNNDKFTIVNMKGKNVDFMGDIRSAFAPGFTSDAYPQLDKIPRDHYMLVQMIHTVEHIEWIYQDTMFQWVYDLMHPGGLLYIVTPNLEYIVKWYLRGVGKKSNLKFPRHEHPDIKISTRSYDFQRWIWFKLYSGGSTGDHHHVCYDAESIGCIIEDSGFSNIRMNESGVLQVIAVKPIGSDGESVDGLILKETL